MSMSQNHVRWSLGVVALLCTSIAVAGCSGNTDAGAVGSPGATVVASTDEFCNTNPITYQGQDGKTALNLLLEHDPSTQTVGPGADAYVTTICGRKASDSDHEYWALYVNGEYAQTGAGSLVTKDGDVISWKIETY